MKAVIGFAIALALVWGMCKLGSMVDAGYTDAKTLRQQAYERQP